MYPKDEVKNLLNVEDILRIPIIHFLQTENIEFISKDALDVILENNNKHTLSILDPPYIGTCNRSYSKPTFDIYEWYSENKNTLLNFCFVLEYMYTIKLLFQNENIILYDKKYNGHNRKQVKHAFIYKKK